jgi:hypothetical protein
VLDERTKAQLAAHHRVFRPWHPWRSVQCACGIRWNHCPDALEALQAERESHRGETQQVQDGREQMEIRAVDLMVEQDAGLIRVGNSLGAVIRVVLPGETPGTRQDKALAAAALSRAALLFNNAAKALGGGIEALVEGERRRL